MLVLTRKVGQKIDVGSDIQITVTDIKQGAVRIGLTAPKSVSIYRTELKRESK